MKIRRRLKRLHETGSLTLFVFMLTLFGPVLFALWNSADAATRYAQCGGSQSGVCASWAAACDLQYAISVSVTGDEIWVKAGTYLPTTETDPDPAPDRTISFTLKNGVAIYGGFGGTETVRDQRSPESNVTILSGDIGISGDATDNSYHVVAITGLDESAILDGFIITGGNANGASPHCEGGGMHNESSSPTLRNITFSNNTAVFDGGGMYNKESSPVLSNITFVNNTVGLQGGGIYNLKSSPVLTNVTLSGNTAGLEGGGIYNLLSSPTLNNVTFSDNSSEIEGVGAYNLCSDFVIATTTTLTSSLNPSTYGASVDFTATVNGSESSSTPTGTVTFTFKDGATTLSTGTLNGTGQATFATSALAAGRHTITAVYSGDESFGGSTSDPFTQTVNEAPAITSSNSTIFIAGHSGAFPVTATGYPAPGLSQSGAFPSGVTFVDNGNGTGTLSGTPAEGTGGKYNLTFIAHNGVGSDATQNFTLTVNEAPAITSPNSTIFVVGHSGAFQVTATGYPAPVLSEAGALPVWVTFNPATGLLSGAPGPGTAGSHNLTFTAHNGVGSDATQNFTLTVNQSPAITSAHSFAFMVGYGGSFSVTTTGFPAPGIGQSGALPGGVTFVDNGNGTGTLSGTPAKGTGGTYNLTFTAHNGVVSDATQNFTLTVNPFDLNFCDDYGRARLCVNSITGDWAYTILAGHGAGNTDTGGGSFVRKGNVLWMNTMDAERWGLNLVYNDKAKKAMATFGDRASGVRSSLIDTDTTDNPAGCD